MRIRKLNSKILLIIFFTLNLFLSSCSGSSQIAATETLTADQVVDPTEEPTIDEAEIVVVVRDEPSLAWHSTGFADIAITRNSYEPLVTRDAAGVLSPALAESWEQINDNTWRFYLRQGLTFHDGKPFNASSVAWHIEMLSAPDFNGSVINKLSDNQISANVIDDFTIDIITESPDPILPIRLYWLYMSSPDSHDADPDSQNMIGTGPYMLETRNQGESIVLVANPDYWGGTPAVNKVTFIWREDPALRLAMLRANEADIAQSILPGEDTSVQILSADIPETAFIRMDPHPPLDDIRVRQAICMAIDREEFVENSFFGFAKLANQLITPDVLGYNPDIPLWAYDPEGARDLIEQARADGVPVDLELTIIGRTAIYTNATKAMEELQLWLTEIGLNVKLEMLDRSSWKEHINTKPVPEERRTIVQSSHGNEAGDGILTMLAYYHSSARKSSFPDSIQDDLISDATFLTGDNRQQALAKVLAYQHDEIIQDCPMVHLQAVWGVSEQVDWEPRFDNLILVMTVSVK
jgi:peptide/nickel transport system substrate-binding protein